MSPYIDIRGPGPVLVMLLLSAIFMGMTLVIFILYGICANGVRAYVATSPRVTFWLQRSFAATFACLGVKLAMTDR